MDSLGARECAKIIKKFNKGIRHANKRQLTYKNDNDSASKVNNLPYHGFASLISQEYIFLHILDFLYLKDIARLDSAITNKGSRPIWLKGLCLCHLDNDVYYSISTTNTIRWCFLRNIRFQSIELCDVVTNEGLYLLSKISEQIGRIIIDTCLSITSNGLSILFKNCPFLESLEIVNDELLEEDLDEEDIFDMKTMNDEVLIQLSASCHNLKDISLEYYFMTIFAFHQLVSNCTLLESIEMKDCFIPTDSYLRSIGNHCPLLYKLELSNIDYDVDDEENDNHENGLTIPHDLLNNSKISNEGIKLLAYGCSLLQVLEISLGSSITDESIVLLTQQCPQLESINLEKTSITNRSLIALGQLAHLSILKVNHCQKITNDGIQNLVKYNSNNSNQYSYLSEIYMKHCLQLSSRSIHSIANHCPLLLKIELGNLYHLPLNQPMGEEIIDSHVIHTLLQKCPQLYHLKFANITEEKVFLMNNTMIKKELSKRLKKYNDSDPFDSEYVYTFY